MLRLICLVWIPRILSTRGSAFRSRKKCEGGNHIKAYGILVHWLSLRNPWSHDSKLLKVAILVNSFPILVHFFAIVVHMHMPSRDHLLHTFFWTKKWTPSMKSGKVESRRSCWKQTILGSKADDLTKANDPKKMFFWLKADDPVYFIFYISKQTISVEI